MKFICIIDWQPFLFYNNAKMLNYLQINKKPFYQI